MTKTAQTFLWLKLTVRFRCIILSRYSGTDSLPRAFLPASSEISAVTKRRDVMSGKRGGNNL